MRILLFIASFLTVTLAMAQTSETLMFTTMQSNFSNTVFANPLAMTITQILAGPKEAKFSYGKVSVYPERSQTPLLKKNGKAYYTYILQKDRTAPLVFVMPGTGGSSTSQSAAYLAEQLYNMGYQAVIVDNSFSWKFVVSGSQSAIPGYAPRDAQDIYKVMQQVIAQLAQKERIQPRSYSLVGSSLGGLLALHVNKVDTQFHFQKIFIINPPLDMVYAVNQLDSLYARGARFSADYKGRVLNRIITVAGTAMGEGQDLQDRAFMQKAFTDLKLQDDDMAYLIGWTFHNSLRDVIYSSQQVHDQGFLKQKATALRQNARYEEANGFTFGQYLTQFVFPSVRAEKATGYTIEKMNQEASIYQFASTIRANKNIYVVHSTDDFLLKQGDEAWLKAQFGDRALLFPYGGHCGSMNFDEFKAQLKHVFAM